MDKIKEIIRAKLKEMLATGQGGATAVPGEGIGMATKPAFSKKTIKPTAYYQVGYEPVPKKIKGSGLEVKKLFETEPLTELNDFQKERIDAFNDIETRLNALYPLVSNAKNETVEYYDANPGSYKLYKPTEMVLMYLKKIEKLLTVQK
jgi:hypothetical protein